MSSTPKPPHIVLYNPDSYRGDVLGHMGNAAAVTPNLDRLVETDAVSFRNAYVQNPVCVPSRCSFMSGWYPHVRGHRSMHHLLRPGEPVLLKTLKDHGYFVWWGGKNHLVSTPDGFGPYCDVKYQPERPLRPPASRAQSTAWRGEPGSDTYYSFLMGRLDPPGPDEPAIGDWAYVRGAVDFIRNAPTDQPLCIYLPLSAPHPPYGVEDPWHSLIDRAKIPARVPAPADDEAKPSMLAGIRRLLNMDGWSEERWAELRATYYGMCARIDHQFGLVLDALREAGLYDDTAVFFFSDHGDFTGDYCLVEKTENTFEDCLTRSPFVVKTPKGRLTPAGDYEAVRATPRVSDALVELVDLPATVEALAGITPAHTHFGRSLLPVLAGDTDEHRDAVFCEGGRLHGETHCMGLEPPASQLPAYPYYPRRSMHRSEGPEHTKAVMCRTREFKYVRRLYERDELYDLREDPAEQHNRIGDPALTGQLAQLKDRLLTFYLETGDVVPHDIDRVL